MDERHTSARPPPSLEDRVVQAPEGHETQSFEAWAKAKNIEAWLVEAARVGENWPEGRELSEADFDAALERVQKIEVR